jgi:transcriptional regulator, AraC family
MPEYQTFTMLQRHKAQLRDSVQLSGGIRLAAWFNSGDRVTNLSDHHTLSLYVPMVTTPGTKHRTAGATAARRIAFA